MGPNLIELKPNRKLLDSNFDGYKLSLQEIPTQTKPLDAPVDRVLLNTSQYTLLHSKLYGLQNHLTGDDYDKTGSVYFADTNWNLNKTYLDPFNDELVDPIPIFKIPKNRERQAGDYNVSLKFVSENFAILSSGTGLLYVLETGSRNDDNEFKILFCDEVAGQDENFILLDGVLRETDEKKHELDVVLLTLKLDYDSEKYRTILHWITLTKDETWSQTSIRQLEVKGNLDYAFLERTSEAVYVVSDNECKFILNSDFPITETKENDERTEKNYDWSQTIEAITIRIPLKEASRELVSIIANGKKIEVKYDGETLLSGDLFGSVESDIFPWTSDDDVLEIVLNKSETAPLWPELICEDVKGEPVSESCVAERLSHLCSETETLPQSGTTFNSQQVEDCDFETDKTLTFDRLTKDNRATHRVHLGSHQVLLTACLKADLSPALGIRHDVDVCLWQPIRTGEEFDIVHEGTLLAFGYVQASKQNKKFSVCPSDLGYSVVCESSRHLFIYRQNEAVAEGELRNRSTGKRVKSVAKQQVVNLPAEEVLGIYATPSNLYLLYESSVKLLKV